MSELVRYVVVADFAVLVMCGATLRAAYAPTVPRALDVFAWLYGVVFVLISAAVIVNVLSPIPPTPGVKVLAWTVTPISVAVVALTFRALLRRP